MKYLAISGRGKAGFLAYFVLEELSKQGVSFEQIAVSGTAALPCVLFHSSLPRKEHMRFLREYGLQLQSFNKRDQWAQQFDLDEQVKDLELSIPIVLSTVDIDSGELQLFESHQIEGEAHWVMNDLSKAIKSTSALGGLESLYQYEGKRLIDSYCKIGVPESVLLKADTKDILKVDLSCQEQPYYRFFDNQLHTCSPDFALFFSKEQLQDSRITERVKRVVKERFQEMTK